ncbi:MAG: M23 family metallopeptidase [Moraxellaceae bacterium]|nr:M23 family metallopeptidase [Moraxellaceae bacterium]
MSSSINTPSFAQTQLSPEEQAKHDELAAMSARLADIQAQMMRLDALGAHVAEKAKVKGDEFDFSKMPPMGGPEEAIRIDVDPIALDRKLSLLNEELNYRELKLKALDRFLQNQRQASVDLDNMPVRDGYITSRFGYRADPFTRRTSFHGGIDFAGPDGTDIFTVADGIVIKAGWHNGYGNMVEIDHGDGLVTRYAHAKSLVVKEGDVVSKDQLIAYMGTTGRSTGVHLHYEVLKNGRQINPSQIMRFAKR